MTVENLAMLRSHVSQLEAENERLRSALDDIADTAEDHVDLGAHAWNSVFTAATEALK